MGMNQCLFFTNLTPLNLPEGETFDLCSYQHRSVPPSLGGVGGGQKKDYAREQNFIILIT